ncbi:MAG: tetratricopeptide repeat protein [Myxococcales bacterium]|nr:tetratricopeptide repeat protein [Myxococcales bacterium]
MSNQSELKQQAMEKLKARDAEGARALFLQAAAQEGINLEALVKRANQHLRDDQVPEATELYLKILDANPTDADALLGLARISMFVGKMEEAEAYATGALRVAPGEGMVYTLFGLLAEAKNQADKAVSEMQKGAELSPDEFLPVYNYGRVLALVGQYDEALPYLLRSTEIEPHNYAAFYTLGTTLTMNGMHKEAAAALNQAMKIAPKNLDVYATLADVLLRNHDPDMALYVLNAGMNECGEHPALLEKAAVVCVGVNKIANAVEYFEKITKQLPTYAQAWLNLANLYILTQDLEKSEAAAKQVLTFEPNNWQAHYNLGNLYEVLNQLDKAEAELRKAADLAPNDVRPWCNLGLVLLRQDEPIKTKEAISILEKAVERAPADEFRPAYNLALAYVKDNRTPRARDILKDLEQRVPQDNEAWDELQHLQQTLFSDTDALKMNLAISSMMWDARRGKAKDDSDE